MPAWNLEPASHKAGRINWKHATSPRVPGSDDGFGRRGTGVRIPKGRAKTPRGAARAEPWIDPVRCPLPPRRTAPPLHADFPRTGHGPRPHAHRASRTENENNGLASHCARQRRTCPKTPKDNNTDLTLTAQEETRGINNPGHRHGVSEYTTNATVCHFRM